MREEGERQEAEEERLREALEETEDGLYDAKLMADKMRRLGAVQVRNSI